MKTSAFPRLFPQSGMTLMELMVAVAIVGILGAVAIPQYRDYVRRGQMTEGISALADYRVKMEQYYQDYRRYGSTGTSPRSSATSPP